MRALALAGLLLAAACASPSAQAAYVDPPGRVVHLSHSQGEIGFSPAGEEQWLQAARNRPLYRGDRLWSGRRSRAELQVGSAAVRLGEDTGLEILDLDDDIAQFQLTQGSLNLRVRDLYRGQSYEVDTPTLAFVIRQPGRYRIDIDPQGQGATIVVWEGAAEAYGQSNRYPLRAGDAVRFYDADLRDYETLGVPRGDAFDRYCVERDRRLDRSESLRYLDHDVAGYAELDEYGSWRQERGYGNVWYPDQVSNDWAPYREGHWVWQEPWGWTWVDDAPWGFAPSHYGRWAQVDNRWGWIPGPREARPIYAPALVAFIGGSGWGASLSIGNASTIGWFPLGPREVYVPSYRASRGYFDRVNVSNTTINITNVTNVYNNYARGDTSLAQVQYANRAIAGAVTAVPGDVFVGARPVRQANVRVDRRALQSAQLSRVAPIAPSARSVIGSSQPSRNQPSVRAFQREVIARHAPPAAQQPFAVRQQQLQRSAGQAPAVRTAQESGGRAGGARQNVRVIAQQQDAIDARAAGTRRDGESRPGKPDRPAQPQPQDRGDRAPGSQQPAADARESSRQPVRQPYERESTDRERQAQAANPNDRAQPGQQPVRQPYERESTDRERQAQAGATKPDDRAQPGQPGMQDGAQRRQASAARPPAADPVPTPDARQVQVAPSGRQSRQRDNGRQQPAMTPQTPDAEAAEARASAAAEARALGQVATPVAPGDVAATPVDDPRKNGTRKQRDGKADESDPDDPDNPEEPRGRKDRS